MTIPKPQDPDSRREWLQTNGIGGYCSSTLTGMNTRRYHGLLIAATKPPLGRFVLLSKLEETLIADGTRFDLSTNRFNNVVHPRGFRYLSQFKLDSGPEWTWEVNDVRVIKRVSMPQDQNTVSIAYELAGDLPCILEVRPLIAFRDHHATTHANLDLIPTVTVEPGLASVQPYTHLPRLFFHHNADQIETTGFWYYGFEYEREKERGLDYIEDLYNPFTLRFSGTAARIIASTEPNPALPAPQTAAPGLTNLVTALTGAASQFIVSRGAFKSVIAGYHWFDDWGRDTMISLPGLTLATGKPEVARGILLAFAASIDQGMLPNRFLNDAPPQYNTADATLWYFEAVRAFLHHTGETAFVRDQLYENLKGIIDWHIRGTRHGIHMDRDFLLHSDEQVTWMDARVDGRCVTPRDGKAVEIQALWYNALRIAADLAKAFRDDPFQKQVTALAAGAAESFNAQFWNQSEDCLYDVVNAFGPDAAIRPNQIIAASLNYTMLSAERAERVLRVVENELLTPRGLRTLSPRDSRYRGRYEGDAAQRDAAYHQGTVWPWLMGAFVTAYMKVNGRSESARRQGQIWLEAFLPHLEEAGLGQVSEIFDGDPPHTPRGCIAQAWSVAELLRAGVEDIYTA